MQTALQERVKDDTEKRRLKMEKEKQSNLEAEKKNKQDIQSLIEKGRSRPLLIESSFGQKKGETLAKVRALRQTVDILKQSGLDPKEFLDGDDKELMAEADYIERRKKELGK